MNGDGSKSQIKELFVPESEKEHLMKWAENVHAINISKVDLQWVQVLSEGWASPLSGFMRESQYLQSLHFNCLFDGQISNQSIPIVLAINQEEKAQVENLKSITLKYDGKIVAVLQDIEVYPHRKEERIARQFGTSHSEHPYIKVCKSPPLLVILNLRKRTIFSMLSNFR